MPDLDLVVPANCLPAQLRNFNRPNEWNVGQIHRVEVVHVHRVGSDSFGVCRGLDDPSWYYEITTPLPIQVGATGTVRNQGYYRKILPRWLFAPETADA